MNQWILQSLKKRYATKMFDPGRAISPEDWEILESALHLCPSGYGLQPWKFLVVQDRETRKRLTAASLGQVQIEQCSYFVVFTSKTSVDETYIDSHVEVVARARQLPKEALTAYYQMMVDDVVHGPKSKFVAEWAARQAYIAIGTLITTAAVLQVDACPMEGIIPESYDEILQLAGTGYRTLAACALGYRDPEDKYSSFAKARFNREQIIQYI